MVVQQDIVAWDDIPTFARKTTQMRHSMIAFGRVLLLPNKECIADATLSKFPGIRLCWTGGQGVFRSVESTTSVGQTGPDMPTAILLEQNYPNSFNPSTEIHFDLLEATTVSLVVYDVLGRQVAELASGYREAVHRNVTWNASNQASGVYFATFHVTDALGNVKSTNVDKLVLMK